MANKYLYADKASRITNLGGEILERDGNDSLENFMNMKRDFNMVLKPKLLPIDDEELSKTRMAQSASSKDALLKLDGSVNEIIVKIEMKKFQNLINNRLERKNNLVNCDAARVFPLSKIADGMCLAA